MAEAIAAPGGGVSRWLPRGAAVAAGAAAGLAQPPFGFLPGLLGYAAILVILDRAAPAAALKSAFARGWLAGVGYFFVCLWWLTEPFQVDAVHQGWMAPFALALVTAGMALFWGAAGLVYRLLTPRHVGRVLVFAGVFAGFEWLRGHVLTGFPWDLPGETWRAGSPMSQTAALVGAYGLSWVTLALAAAPAVIARGWPGRATVVGALVALAALYGYGADRLRASPGAAGALRLRIVQANIGQSSKYDPAMFDSIVQRYLALTREPSRPPVNVVIWPEGAIPDAIGDYLAPGTWTRAAITDALSPGESLILGGYRFAGQGSSAVAYNTLAVFRRTGSELGFLGLYDKFRLVPFGEFIPFDALADRLGIKAFVHVGAGFAPGPRPRPLRIGGLPLFQPLICYEALYPGFTREGAKAAGQRPEWIVNVSNDAWFGITSGPLQHLNIASYRAIEEGLPMVRATPTGVSAVIDGYGRTIASLPIGAMGVIDHALPPALAPTPFTRFGGLAFAVMCAVSLAAAGWRKWR